VQEEFDALVVCNGHYTTTNLPEVSGSDAFPGLLMHSHNYRAPEAFAGQVVVVVGASMSGEGATPPARAALLPARAPGTADASDDRVPLSGAVPWLLGIGQWRAKQAACSMLPAVEPSLLAGRRLAAWHGCRPGHCP
jgi:hypothetical protein